MQIELDQGSLEWHEHRAKFRNASEAGTVMDVSPWQTKRELWESKNGLGTPFVGNVATAWGNEHEPTALEAVSKLLGVDLQPTIFVEGDYSASLDGYGVDDDGRTVSVEIKCPYQKERSKLWAQVQSDGMDRIPENYYWQMVHQQLCAKADRVYFFVYIPGLGYDEQYDLVPFQMKQGDEATLIEAWDLFCSFEPDPDWIERDDEVIVSLVKKHRRLVAEKKFIDGEVKAVEKALKAEAGMKNVTAFGSMIQVIEKKGSVDYRAIPELKGIDLEDFRKPGSTYQKITHPRISSNGWEISWASPQKEKSNA